MRRLCVLAAVLAVWACDDGDSDPPPDPGVMDAGEDAATVDQGQVDMTAQADMGPVSDMLAMVDMQVDMVIEMDAAPMVAMGVNPGQRAPDFTLMDADGNSVSLSDFAGRPVMVAGASAW